jgi:poly-gamma-glutamate capsule biosynthesis protein CapA/YwtB (metallophosphatase superfamily)
MTHSRLATNALLLSAWLFSFLSAEAAPCLQVSLDIPEDLLPVWEKVVTEAPLPKAMGFESRRVPQDPAADAIVLLRRDRSSPVTMPGLTWKTVERRYFAPVASLGDPNESTASDAAIRPVLPLERIELPSMGLAVDGRYAGQPEYPFCEETDLGLRSRDPRLISWFESVPEAEEDPVIWIGAVGDVMPARGVDGTLAGKGTPRPADGVNAVFGDTLPILRGCDILLGNLEAAATRSGSREQKTYNFRFDPDALGALKNAGFSCFSVANNHSFDYGARGFLDTLENLSAFGIKACGGGQDLDEALTPVEIGRGGSKIRILSFAAYPREASGFDGRRITAAGPGRPGVLWLNADTLKEASRVFSRDSFNVAMVHGGIEYADEPTKGQRLLYRELLDAGADLVIGSHPHVIQGMEARSGGLIAYSLGNFIFPGMEGMHGGTVSVILLVGVYRGKIRYVRDIPVRLNGRGVRIDPLGHAAAKMRELTAELASNP